MTATPSVQESRSVPVVEQSAHRDDIDIATLRHVKPKHYGRMVAMVKGRYRGNASVGFLTPMETIIAFLLDQKG